VFEKQIPYLLLWKNLNDLKQNMIQMKPTFTPFIH